MKRQLISLFILLAFACGPLFAQTAPAPEYDRLNKAALAFTEACKYLRKTIPKIDSADEAAAVIERFSASYVELIDSMIEFAKKHPEETRTSQPPKELVAGFTALGQIRTEGYDIGYEAGRLGARYRFDPRIIKAGKKMSAGIKRWEAFVKTR